VSRPLILALALAGAAWIWHRIQLTRQLRRDRQAWRDHLATGLAQAATNNAGMSQAAAAALTMVAEAIRSTGQMGVLESSVLAERVARGAQRDAEAVLAPGLRRSARMLSGIATARELLRVLEPTSARDQSLVEDAIRQLDAVSRAGLDTPHST
jgi:hypothetical protein